jgi:hypothetical protein
MSDKDVEVLKRKVEESNTNIVKILGYLHNDTGTGEKGLIADFRDHKIDFTAFKRKYDDNQLVKKTAITIYGGIGAAIFIAVKWLVGLVITHLHL